MIQEYHPHFFTATCLEWKNLLKPDKYKNIIIESLRFLVEENRVKIYSFVIMNNHIHIIWQIQVGNTREKVQLSFLKYTAQQIKFDLIEHHPQVLKLFRVNAKDREYQFWVRNSLSVELSNQDIFLQKLNYIHENPVKKEYCQLAEDYKYSSAQFYENGIDVFGFLSHHLD
jgi:putative transposase